MKPGRNSLCPCGSGKKYKRCCGSGSSPSPVAAKQPVSDSVAIARKLLASGRAVDADAMCQRLIAANSSVFEALELRANIFAGTGQSERACDLYQKALKIQPDNPVILYNFGTMAMNTGRTTEAVEAFTRASQLNPADRETLENLGVALTHAGRFVTAVDIFRKLTVAYPRHISGHLNLASVLATVGNLRESEDVIKGVLDQSVENFQALSTLAYIHNKRGEEQAAIEQYAALMEKQPDNALILSNLESIYAAQGRWHEARALLARQIERAPDDLTLKTRLAACLASEGDLGAALNLLDSLASDGRDNPLLQHTYARCYAEFGLVRQAVKHYERTLALEPGNNSARLTGIMLQHYLPDMDESALVAAARQYASTIESAVPALEHASVSHATRLRIGFVSADLRQHSVGYFMLPVFRELDRSRFEVFVYDNSANADDVTRQMQDMLPHWRFIDGLSDEEAQRLILDDRVDVLIDLSGLTRGNRLGIFARRAAPTQVTWIGYPATTGLASMDYRITDRLSDPEESAAQWYTEKLYYLPEIFSVYSPPEKAPAVAPLPALANAHVTFGSFNNFNKLNDAVLNLWGRLLQEVPQARLYLKSKVFQHEQTRSEVMQIFTSVGVARERIVLRGEDPDLQSHLQRYAEIDIALDPFPYCGTTTSCEALWMGVPVITLVGEVHRSRVGLSQLTTLGLAELAAGSEEEYVAIARQLAQDLPRLRGLREGMRARMRSSALTDAPRFVRNFEQALEAMQRG